MNGSTSQRGWRRVTSLAAICLLLCPLTLACSGNSSKSGTSAVASPAPTESYPNLAIQAKEIGDTLARKDFARFTALTYPKVIELLGGRDKMIATTSRQLQQM